MNNKIPVISYICILILFLLLSACGAGEKLSESAASSVSKSVEPEPEAYNGPEQISLASFNIRILSHKSRSDEELQQIASLLDDYDMTAIQEVRDVEVMERLGALLPGYSWIISNPAGNKVKERYAYLYKNDLINVLGTPHLYADEGNRFIREPYIASFKAGNFDFTLISIHVLFGKESERREEIKLLDDVIAAVDSYNGSEDDVILLGDFNFSASESSFEIITHTPIIPPDIKTTISDKSSYDNMWLNSDETGEWAGAWGMDRFDETLFGGDDKAASLAVSDHRPISTIFYVAGPDDDEEGSWNVTGGGPVSVAVSHTSEYRSDGDIIMDSVTSSPTSSEQIVLLNRSEWPVDISDWTLGDLNDPLACDIARGTVINPSERKIFHHDDLGFTINNSGEILFLKDPSGTDQDVWKTP